MAALVLTGVGLGLFGLAGHARAQEASDPVAFARSEVAVPDGGARSLTLFNNTTAELLLTVRVGPANQFAVATSAQRVGPGGAVTVRVSDVGAPPGAAGRVTVVGSSTGNPLAPGEGGVARATVTVAEPAGEAEPLVDEWTVTSYRFKPWGDATENPILPLRDAASCDDVVVPGGTVGGVSASPGAARVEASCRDAATPGSDVGAELAFPGLGHHTGEYRGEADLAPGSEAGAVRLTVRRTDYVLLPLVVALVGVAAAVVVARVRRRLDDRAAGEREARLLQAEVDAAHRAFAERSHDRSWSGCSFRADADERLRAVLDGRREPEGAGEPGAGGGAGADVRDRLEPVARAAAAWPALADRLAELDLAVAEVGLKAASHRPPGPAGSPGPAAAEPACLVTARPLLTAPSHPLTVREALALAAEVDAATTVTARWLDWAGAVAQLEARADLLTLAVEDLPADHDDQQRLAEARSGLATARRALWDAAGPADLDDSGALTALERARAGLDGLDHHVSGPAAGGEPGHEATAPVARPGSSSLAAALSAPAWPSGRGRAQAGVDRRVRRRSAVALTGTALVAAWSGLAVLYFDEAFGTPGDYLGLFVWAFTAQAALAALVAAADRLATRAPARP